MSLQPVLWALKSAPVKDVEEFAILAVMAEAADEDGCNSFQSQGTIARRTKLAVRTVSRRIEEMEARGLLGLGDQAAAAYLPEHARPVVWDLLIPYLWFPDIAETQDWRAKRGRPALTAKDRPDMGPAPEAKRRADAGMRRLRVVDDQGDGDAGTTVTHDSETGGDLQTGGVYESPGDCQSETPCLVDPDPPSSSRTNSPKRNTPQEKHPPGPRDARPSAARGTRIPDNWEPSEALKAWARENAPGIGWTEHEKFMDHWRAQPGTRGRKSDWDATWRNWMRRAYEDGAGRQGFGRQTQPISKTDAAVHDLAARSAAWDAEDRARQLQIGDAR